MKRLLLLSKRCFMNCFIGALRRVYLTPLYVSSFSFHNQSFRQRWLYLFTVAIIPSVCLSSLYLLIIVWIQVKITHVSFLYFVILMFVALLTLRYACTCAPVCRCLFSAAVCRCLNSLNCWT